METNSKKVLKQPRKSYPISFKLQAIELAEATSNRQAANAYSIDESVVRRWRNNKVLLQGLPNKQCKTVLKCRPIKWSLLEANLKEWLKTERLSGRQISGSMILLEARRQAEQLKIDDFKGSPKWVHSFLKRNDSVGPNLPDDWENKMKLFINSVNKLKYNLELHQIGNMDEVPVTFDMPAIFRVDCKGSSDMCVATAGTNNIKFTVVLCVTADGEKLPPYVIFRCKTIPKGKFPKNVIVSANEKSSMTSTETQLWIDRVWNNRIKSFNTEKSLLMLDAVPGHKTAHTKEKFVKTGTQIALIPAGLTKKLQVLEISVNKSFKAKLRKQWEAWMIKSYKEYKKSGELKKASYEKICKWISVAWQEIPKSTIINGFKKTNISFYEDEQSENEEMGNNVSDDDTDGEQLCEAPAELWNVLLTKDYFYFDEDDE